MIFAGRPPHAQLEELTELPQTAELYLMGPTSKWREETKEGRGGKVREVDGSAPQIFWPRTALECRSKGLFLRLTSRK